MSQADLQVQDGVFHRAVCKSPGEGFALLVMTRRFNPIAISTVDLDLRLGARWTTDDLRALAKLATDVADQLDHEDEESAGGLQ